MLCAVISASKCLWYPKTFTLEDFPTPRPNNAEDPTEYLLTPSWRCKNQSFVRAADHAQLPLQRTSFGRKNKSRYLVRWPNPAALPALHLFPGNSEGQGSTSALCSSCSQSSASAGVWVYLCDQGSLLLRTLLWAHLRQSTSDFRVVCFYFLPELMLNCKSSDGCFGSSLHLKLILRWTGGIL